MLHNTTGHRETDHLRSIELFHSVLDYCSQQMVLTNMNLHPSSGDRDISLGTTNGAIPMNGCGRVQRGVLLAKILRGAEDRDALKAACEVFEEARFVKPAASRSSSAEIYILARSGNWAGKQK
jgi:23S rRNA U2552 (ribose-2'-O)-methylase RlmE/FtsJ